MGTLNTDVDMATTACRARLGPDGLLEGWNARHLILALWTRPAGSTGGGRRLAARPLVHGLLAGA